jgi:biopolymer transport protein ExbB/TolQ
MQARPARSRSPRDARRWIPLVPQAPGVKPATNKNLVGLLVSAGVLAAAPLIGLAATVLFLRGAFAGAAAADPSEKARVLAEGIAESMNAMAFGLAVSVIAIVPTVVFAVRLHRESKRQAPPR